MLDVPNILLAVTAAANLVLMWFVYGRDRRNAINRLFALFVLFIASWALIILLFRLINDPGIALVLIELSYVSALLLAFFFYHFAILFPRSGPASPLHRLGSALIAGGVIVYLLLPEVLARAITFHPWGKEVVLDLFGWSIFALAFLYFFLGGLACLLWKVRSVFGIERTQLLAIAGAVIVAGAFGMFYNLVLPSPVFRNFQYIWTGPLFTFLFAVSITYAIFRYKLFNPKAAIAELLVFTLLLLLLVRFLLASASRDRWTEGLLLVAVSVVGVLLIRSVNREIRQREVIEHQKEEIERASAEKSEFMSFASHEIRNPVTAMRGYASLILEGDLGAVSPQVRDAVGKIFATSNDVLTLITQFLDKSKLELGQITYSPVVFDLAKTIRDIAAAVRPAVKRKGLGLIINADRPVWTRADRDKVKEAIGNIVDNAIKYTSKGSVTVSVESRANIGRVAVTDSGIWIAPEVIPHLFRKFSRADAQRVNIHGSGIGLYLAKVFVEAQAGRIWAESDGAGEGARFIIELPTAAAQIEVSEHPQANGQAPPD